MVEYDVVRLDTSQFPIGADTSAPIDIVYRREDPASAWEPWVLVAESALLRRVAPAAGPGALPPNPGSRLGLYAARGFAGPRETRLGRKEGEALGNYAESASVVHHGNDRPAHIPELTPMERREMRDELAD